MNNLVRACLQGVSFTGSELLSLSLSLALSLSLSLSFNPNCGILISFGPFSNLSLSTSWKNVSNNVRMRMRRIMLKKARTQSDLGTGSPARE